MFLDASAICALLLQEADADELMDKLELVADRRTSPVAIFEATLAVCREMNGGLDAARATLESFLRDFEVRIVEIGAAESAAALDAFDRFGKGRHPARLNMGDCFAYACAKTNRVPLLCKGDDFRQTDAWIA